MTLCGGRVQKQYHDLGGEGMWGSPSPHDRSRYSGRRAAVICELRIEEEP